MMTTLEQIAREAGVSRGTVANVLKGRISKDRAGQTAQADEIRAIAKRLGYRPNAAAVATVTGRFGCFGLLTGLFRRQSFLPETLLEGITNAMDEHDLHLLLAHLPLPEDKREEASAGATFVRREMPKMLREGMMDGLLVNGIEPALTRGLDAVSPTFPVVAVNAKSEHNCIFPDDRGATRRLTKHLLERGHTRIAYVEPCRSHHFSAGERRGGYRDAMAKAGLSEQIITASSTSEEERCVQARAVLGFPERPTALVFYETSLIVHPFFCAALERGWQVPRDLSLVSVSNRGHFPLLCGINLSHLEVPFFEMGRQAVELLVGKRDDPAQQLAPVTVPYDSLEGNTCAAPARQRA